MAAVIETAGLTKQWGDLVAVDHLDLSVEQGECYAFLGRNGSGKSTTARMLLDFIRPTAGSSRLLGGVGSDPAIRARVGYLPGYRESGGSLVPMLMVVKTRGSTTIGQSTQSRSARAVCASGSP